MRGVLVELLQPSARSAMAMMMSAHQRAFASSRRAAAAAAPLPVVSAQPQLQPHLQHSSSSSSSRREQLQLRRITCLSTSSDGAVATASNGVAAPLPAAQPTLGVSSAQTLTGPVILGQAAARVYSSSIQGNQDLLQQLLRPPAAYAQGHDILDSIVKVFTVHSRPNNFMPWQVRASGHVPDGIQISSRVRASARQRAPARQPTCRTTPSASPRELASWCTTGSSSPTRTASPTPRT